MTHLHQLATPACIIDVDKFKRNCQRMRTVANAENISLRPHVKTLKSLQAAHYYAPSPMPVTVSTLAEARYFASAGYTDILYAVGIAPNKLSQLDAILKVAEDFTVIADNISAVQALVDYAPQFSQPLAVMLEVDVDDHRAGLLPESDELVACAKAIQNTPALRFRGVMTHAGGSYDCRNTEERQAIAHQECQRISFAAEQLKQHGISCDVISAGSTPTALAGVSHNGINELRAGVYATFDCVMAGLGVCEVTDIAMSVLTCIIGHQHNKNWVIVDAGWMALSRDQGTADLSQDCGYGLVCDINGELLDGWYVKATNQEHGIICHRDNITPPETLFSYGQILRILPIHACATSAQFTQYHVVNKSLEVSQVWSRINGW